MSARTWGALAVIGLVAAFSLSSTLAKRAETPGVLLAFWRLTIVSLAWNALLWRTGRRVTVRHLRQALLPGLFFGLNLAAFFTGATLLCVAPFLIVPLGARLFHERYDPRALFFALVAFGGVTLVLFNAPPNGDASARGNLFGVLAMLLLVGYVVSTRAFRRDMDVPTFMATVSPIAAVAVLPLAVANGGMFELSGTGWTYTVLLAFLSGMAANGLLVFAQKTIQIGTIGIAQEVQPALAVTWSYLLLGETLRPWQAVGVAVVVGGLVAFTGLNQRVPRLPGPRKPGDSGPRGKLPAAPSGARPAGHVR